MGVVRREERYVGRENKGLGLEVGVGVGVGVVQRG